MLFSYFSLAFLPAAKVHRKQTFRMERIEKLRLQETTSALIAEVSPVSESTVFSFARVVLLKAKRSHYIDPDLKHHHR